MGACMTADEKDGARRALLDPRTKVVLLAVLAVFCLGGAGGERLAPFRELLSLLPFVLMSIDGRRTYALSLLGVLMFCIVYQTLLFAGTGGPIEAVLVLVTSVFLRLIPCLAMGSYAMSSTTVSEFVAAMERLHLPRAVTIPLSVMFRFVPTVCENARSVGEALRMRRTGRIGLSRWLEYRLVPLVECTARSANDLSASALLRGLGAPVGRTSIARIGLGMPDVAVAVALIASLGVSLVVTS